MFPWQLLFLSYHTQPSFRSIHFCLSARPLAVFILDVEPAFHVRDQGRRSRTGFSSRRRN